MENNVKEIVKQINENFEKSKIYFDVFEEDGKICCNINDGDWKHHHSFFNYAVRTFLEHRNIAVASIEEVVTKSSGDDAYSAKHIITLEKTVCSTNLRNYANSFSNTLYISEHGKRPSGVGSWAFFVNIKDEDLTRFNCKLKHYADTETLSIIWANGVKSLVDAKHEVDSCLMSMGYWNQVVYIAD